MTADARSTMHGARHFKCEVQDAILGFKKMLVKEPYCQRCLGDASFDKSIARQVGSILYFKVYRPWWEKKREKEEVLI